MGRWKKFTDKVKAEFSDDAFIEQSKEKQRNDWINNPENQPESYKLAQELVNAITEKLDADSNMPEGSKAISQSSREAAENMRNGLNTAMSQWKQETIKTLEFPVERNSGEVSVGCQQSKLEAIPISHKLDAACKQTIERNAEKMTSAGPLSGLKGLINKIAKIIGLDKPFQEEKTHLGNDDTISKDIGGIDNIEDRGLKM